MIYRCSKCGCLYNSNAKKNHGYCKRCHREYNRRHYRENKDKIIAHKKKYYQTEEGKTARMKTVSSHIGERRKNNNEEWATIVEVVDCDNSGNVFCKLRWDDGTISERVQYSCILRGEFAHPTHRPDSSKGERDIADILTRVGIEFVREYSDEHFVDNGRKRYMDFYIPELNLFIEFNGIQHFEYVPYFHDKTEDGNGGRDGYGGFCAFTQEKAIDDFKWRTCKSLGCELWYFADDEEYTKDWRYPVHTIDELPGMLADKIEAMVSRR